MLVFPKKDRSSFNTKACTCNPKYWFVRNESCTIIVGSYYVIDPQMFSNSKFDSRLPQDCASSTGDRSSAVYSRSVFLSGLNMARIKFPVVGYAQTFIK